MNIGLLVSEIEDKEVKRICIGACQAAKDKNVTLVILPGKQLRADIKEDNPYDYHTDFFQKFYRAVGQKVLIAPKYAAKNSVNGIENYRRHDYQKGFYAPFIRKDYV